MIKKDGLQTAAEERQKQSKEFRTEAARQSIPKRWTNNGKACITGGFSPAVGGSNRRWLAQIHPFFCVTCFKDEWSAHHLEIHVSARHCTSVNHSFLSSTSQPSQPSL